MTKQLKIMQIVGIEPMREGEYPICYKVGVDEVTSIEFNERSYGDHGIGEFLVWKGGVLHSSVTHRALGEIIYAPDEDGQ